jgi:hypothetical protein
MARTAAVIAVDLTLLPSLLATHDYIDSDILRGHSVSALLYPTDSFSMAERAYYQSRKLVKRAQLDRLCGITVLLC